MSGRRGFRGGRRGNYGEESYRGKSNYRGNYRGNNWRGRQQAAQYEMPTQQGRAEAPLPGDDFPSLPELQKSVGGRLGPEIARTNQQVELCDVWDGYLDHWTYRPRPPILYGLPGFNQYEDELALLIDATTTGITDSIRQHLVKQKESLEEKVKLLHIENKTKPPPKEGVAPSFSNCQIAMMTTIVMTTLAKAKQDKEDKKKEKKTENDANSSTS